MRKDFLNNMGLALLRIAPAAMLLTHGIPKFQRLIGEGEIEFGDPIGIGPVPSLFLAVIGEALCPILLILGFKTRWVAIPPAMVMLVAVFRVHAADPFNVKEKALLFLVCLIAIILLGPGKYSIDRK